METYYSETLKRRVTIPESESESPHRMENREFTIKHRSGEVPSKDETLFVSYAQLIERMPFIGHMLSFDSIEIIKGCDVVKVELLEK